MTRLSSPTQQKHHGLHGWRSQRMAPLVLVLLGAVILVAQILDDEVLSGLIWFAVLAVSGGALLFGGRSEVVRQARGDAEDERDATINTRALAATGLVSVLALTGCLVYALARGESLSPYVELIAVAGATYAIVLLLLRRWS